MSTTHDPTAQKGEKKAGTMSPQEKIDGALHLCKQIGTAMFVSHSSDGKLASRAMIPATTEGLVFSFYHNKDSGKSDDMLVISLVFEVAGVPMLTGFPLS